MITSQEAENPDSALGLSQLQKSIDGLAISTIRPQTVFPIIEAVRGHPSSPRWRTGRRYVGVVLNQEDQLPAAIGEPRKRRLGLVNLRTEAANILQRGVPDVSAIPEDVVDAQPSPSI